MAIYRKNKKWSAKKYTVCEFDEFEGTTIARQYLSDVKPIDFDKVRYKEFPFIVLDLIEAFESAMKVALESRMWDCGEIFEPNNTDTTLPKANTTFNLTALSQMTTESLNELRIVRVELGDFEGAAKLRDEIKRRDEK